MRGIRHTAQPFALGFWGKAVWPFLPFPLMAFCRRKGFTKGVKELLVRSPRELWADTCSTTLQFPGEAHSVGQRWKLRSSRGRLSNLKWLTLRKYTGECFQLAAQTQTGQQKYYSWILLRSLFLVPCMRNLLGFTSKQRIATGPISVLSSGKLTEQFFLDKKFLTMEVRGITF